jgi:DnaD/phage-associated family protein
MSIIRIAKKKNPFVMIDKACLEDPRLSWKAKGLLAYLLSRPDDWNVQVNHLIRQSTDGRDAVYAAIKELREYGYCYRSPDKIKGEGGKFIGYEYTVYETSEKPYTGFPDTENPDVNNKDSTDINEEEEQPPNIFKLYEQNIGPMVPTIAQDMDDLSKELPAFWFEEAFKIAAANGARNWAYCKAILLKWKAKGFGYDDRPKKGKNHAAKGNIQPDERTKEQEQRDLELARKLVERRRA